MGLDLGFEQEGFEIRVAVDKDRYAEQTIKANRPSVEIIRDDIGSDQVTGSAILHRAGLEAGEATVLTAATPCEPFTTIGKRLSVQDKRASLIDEFISIVMDTQPQYWVFENVPGLLWAARKHISFYKRTTNGYQEDEDEQIGSAWEDILEAFLGTGYEVSHDVLNAADFGTPQKRRRLIVVGSRDGRKVELPSPTHGELGSLEVSQDKLNRWRTVGDALSDFDDPYPDHATFPRWGKYLKHVPEGGCWKDIPEELQEEAIGKAYESSGGRTGFLRRLSRKRPSPTLVDSPITRAACLCHPVEIRPLTVGEYMKLQGFPDHWKVEGPRSSKYRLIGQATPVPLARAVAKAIVQHLDREPKPSKEFKAQAVSRPSATTH